MEGFPINLTDILIVALLLLSGVLAFFRGAVRELFTVVAWIGAILATLYGFSTLKPFAREYIGTPLIADIAAGASLFVVTLVVISLISARFTRRVRESGHNALDRSLGFLFGLVRGVVLVFIAYFLISPWLPPDRQPEWITGSRAIPLVEYGAALIVEAIPADSRPGWTASLSEIDRVGDAAIETSEAFETLMGPPPPSAANATGASGYTNAERKALDRLIQSAE